jgi:hypothetical protein
MRRLIKSEIWKANNHAENINFVRWFCGGGSRLLLATNGNMPYRAQGAAFELFGLCRLWNMERARHILDHVGAITEKT